MSKQNKDSSSKVREKLRLIVNREDEQQEQQGDQKNKAPQAPKRANNFWNTCPLQLDYLPTSPCELGEKSCKAKSEEAAPCPWSINSKEHNYCFWRYVRDNSLPNGQMRPLLQNEISQLLGCSPTKVHFTEKEAKQKLKDSGQLETLVQLITGSESGSDDQDLNQIVDRLEQSLSTDDE